MLFLPSRKSIVSFTNATTGGTVIGLFDQSSDTIVWKTSNSNNYVGIGADNIGRLSLYKSSGKVYIHNNQGVRYFYALKVFA